MYIIEKRDEILSTFGHSLKMIRNKKGLTLKQLSNKAKITKSHIHKIEKGEGNPSLLTIKMLADALNTSPYNLVRFI